MKDDWFPFSRCSFRVSGSVHTGSLSHCRGLLGHASVFLLWRVKTSAVKYACHLNISDGPICWMCMPIAAGHAHHFPHVATWHIKCLIREVSAYCCQTIRLCDHMRCRWILRQIDFLLFQPFCLPLQILTALHQQSNITIIVSCCEVANQLINAFFLSIRLTENIEPILMFDFVIHVMVRWRESSDYVWPLKSVLRALVLTRTFLFYPEIT